jgi:hypothetical protein
MAMVGATCVERDRIRRTAGVRVARNFTDAWASMPGGFYETRASPFV